VGPLTARADQVAAIISWVHREMTYEITPAWLDDITLLARKRGDCTEYSQLTVSMLRALGIPARVRSGFLASGQTLVAHAWIDYFDGTAWQEADPTNGRTTVDASYVDASVLEVLSLLSLGQIEITSME
jgi:transglutaminase-like putative cysteine protease